MKLCVGYLPLSPRKFQGQIGTTYLDSQAEIPAVQSAREGAPNVLLVMLDDVGCDLISPLSAAYESPFRFTGTIKRVLVDISDLEFQDLAALVKMAMAIQ